MGRYLLLQWRVLFWFAKPLFHLRLLPKFTWQISGNQRLAASEKTKKDPAYLIIINTRIIQYLLESGKQIKLATLSNQAHGKGFNWKSSHEKAPE